MGYQISCAILIVLVIVLVISWRKHKYSSVEIADQIGSAQVSGLDASDPKYGVYVHRNAQISLLIGFGLFLIDWVSRFPEDATNYRLIYGAMIAWGAYRLVRDGSWRQPKK